VAPRGWRRGQERGPAIPGEKCCLKIRLPYLRVALLTRFWCYLFASLQAALSLRAPKPSEMRFELLKALNLDGYVRRPSDVRLLTSLDGFVCGSLQHEAGAH
jgi:hypothetical protein